MSCDKVKFLTPFIAKMKLSVPPLQVSPAADATVTVVGDTHGQLHDVVKL